MANPTVFVSYSWDSEDHKNWVRFLATKLQENGIRVLLDQWDTYLGIDLLKYMESSIRDSDFVLLICTPIFAKKANLGEGGVGYEKIIVTGEIYNSAASPKKFVPILRSGHPRESLPSYLKAKLYSDFSMDDQFQTRLEELLRHIFNSPRFSRPKLGGKPVLKSTENGRSSLSKKIVGIPISALREVYDFAYDTNGMNLGRIGAEQFAKW